MFEHRELRRDGDGASILEGTKETLDGERSRGYLEILSVNRTPPYTLPSGSEQLNFSVEAYRRHIFCTQAMLRLRVRVTLLAKRT